MKKLLLSFLFVSFSCASYEKVTIGKIDDYYKDKITKKELEQIIKEIEYIFESTLKKDIFDYSIDGKPIDILYVPNTQLEDKISKKLELIKKKKEKIEELQEYFPSKKREIEVSQDDLNGQIKVINQKVEDLNSYIKNVNSRKNVTKEEYSKIEEYVKNEKYDINNYLKEKNKTYQDLQNILSSYNQKVVAFNNLVRESNGMIKELESLGRDIKTVNGRTFGMKETVLKTYYKDGKEVKESTTTNSMNKIEIYNFDSLEHLKVILAHEIAHLVGVPHIDDEGALMNPILQENQKSRLHLTSEDIENFRKNF
jgi:chromosome segregation ATPase